MLELVHGRIESSPDSNDEVLVVVPDFDDEQSIGRCPYMPREDAPPAAGMDCIVALSDATRPSWVLAYTP